MQYLGGKRQIAKHIAPLILDVAEGAVIWEPFVGGANMTPHLRSALCTDVHPALITLYKALSQGWLPPAHITEYEYAKARELPDENPLKGWAGFACSFGGKYFGGYGRCKIDKKHPNQTPQPGARKELLKSISTIRAAVFECVDFLTVVPPNRSNGLCIYADPPYMGTT